jgi:hypothetical protein
MLQFYLSKIQERDTLQASSSAFISLLLKSMASFSKNALGGPHYGTTAVVKAK